MKIVYNAWTSCLVPWPSPLRPTESFPFPMPCQMALLRLLLSRRQACDSLLGLNGHTFAHLLVAHQQAVATHDRALRVAHGAVAAGCSLGQPHQRKIVWEALH